MRVPRFRCFAVRSIILGFFVLFMQSAVYSSTINLHGLVTGWVTGSVKNITKPSFGIRFIPEFTLKKSFSQNLSIDFEASFNAYGASQINAPSDGEIDLYRMWGRISTSRFEFRMGLQKINFGSASLLRPLMWFESIDPRDPLQLTDGVTGLLFRYYFLNNANIWIWGLYGNDNLKGWEFFPTRSRSAEYGGRLQMPLGNGEWAVSFHHRRMDPRQGPLALSENDLLDNGVSSFPEDRYGFDGKWDVGIGLWFEGSLTHQRTDLLPSSWQRAVNIGLDYTFGVGNGLYALTESFFYTSSDKAFGAGDGITFSALSLGYPLGLLDNLSCIVYYDWSKKNLYSFVNWRRTYDRWIINVIGFWNPEQFQIYQNLPRNNLYGGMGFQILVVFNY
ncbi:MAG: hypothetical protein KKB53_07990 [Acidobacteria bacterium]|nr:hypothetical protein [Acidobacteriota bacterium]MBU4494701.1 hypothetical protein [Acidobacteriota bacterium]